MKFRITVFDDCNNCEMNTYTDFDEGKFLEYAKRHFETEYTPPYDTSYFNSDVEMIAQCIEDILDASRLIEI